MDPKQFYEFLSRYGEVTQRRAATMGTIAEPKEPDIVYRHGYEFTIDSKNNPTRTLVFKKLHDRIENCEDCGQTVTNRVVNYKLSDFPTKHWRASCSGCQKTYNPETGCFDLFSREIGNKFKSLSDNEQPISVIKFKKPAK